MISRSGIEVSLLKRSTDEPYPKLEIPRLFPSDRDSLSEIVSVPDKDAFKIRVVVRENFDWGESDLIQPMVCYGKNGRFYRFRRIRRPETARAVSADLDLCSVWHGGLPGWQGYCMEFLDMKVRLQERIIDLFSRYFPLHVASSSAQSSSVRCST